MNDWTEENNKTWKLPKDLRKEKNEKFLGILRSFSNAKLFGELNYN